MKRTLYFGVLLGLFASCEDTLDRDILTALSKERVIHSYDFTRNTVSAVYNVLPDGFSEIGGALQATVTDEAEHTSENSSVHRINNGAWNPYNNPDDRWNHYYRGIRKANQALANIDSVNLDMYRLDPDPTQQQVYGERLAEMNRWKYEVRFLRAFFYAELIKRYGGVPIVEGIFELDADVGDIRRSTLASSIQYVLDECDSAARVLPATYGGGDLGRATKGAALALKSRVLLYAASDLYNDPSWAAGYADPGLIALPAGDRVARWQAAAAAAKAVIDLPGAGYALHGGYPALFKTFNSPEIIFTRRSGASNSFEIASFPIGYDLGQSGNAPSQNLVDAYEVLRADGTAEPFDWDNAAHAADPYASRDPRLAHSVLVNNTAFKGRAVESWVGGRDGPGANMASKTGYYLRKYVDENVNLLTGTTSIHSWIYIRLAEVYLNYAEALNESDPGHPDIKRYVDLVRARSGVSMPPLPEGLDQALMRQRIRAERRVELAFEGHRLWDTKRWMVAPETLGAPLRGVEIRRSGDSGFSYRVTQVETRTFQPRMYCYPIGQQELLKATGLVQNPMW